jgi:predicted PurR-regulated permease PerM
VIDKPRVNDASAPPAAPAPVTPVTRTDVATWMVAAIGLALVIKLHLLSALLAGLLVFKLVDVLTPWLRLRALGHDGPRILAVMLIAAAVIGALVALAIGIIAFLRNSGETFPALMQKMAEIIEEARAVLPASLQGYVPDDADSLQRTIADWLRSNASIVQLAGRGIGRSLAHILLGMVIGALLSMQKAAHHAQRRPFSEIMAQQGTRLAAAFQRVVFAQVWISLINTFFTWLYLDVGLRAFGYDLPLVKVLVAFTFVVGLVPILGNLISNTAIVIVCLSQGVPLALVSLVYLVVIHKLEYFLNARIIGSHVNARAWELLIAMLVMQAAFGMTGLIAAPIFYAYFKEEFRAKGLV